MKNQQDIPIHSQADLERKLERLPNKRTRRTTEDDNPPMDATDGLAIF